MLKKYGNIKVNYKFVDNNKKNTIVFLHGWGQNIEMMIPLGEKIGNEYNLLYIDLPGFGLSDEPDTVWSVSDYAQCVNKIIKDLKIKNVTIIGHSFGGRIGLIYTSIYKTDNLVCLASPFIKELTKLPFKTRVYKFIRQIPGFNWLGEIMKNYIGSDDYKKASNTMRGVLVKSINIDMLESIKKIKSKTLLIWGENDTAVKVNRAYELNKLIKNSKLVIYPNATHYAYLENIDKVAEEIKNFLG